MDLQVPLSRLKSNRKVFHSEADFQFALAWELQRQYPDASVRLEYPPPHDPTKYVEILVRVGRYVYPIELKYKTKLFSAVVDGEPYYLKNDGAQDMGKYDFVKAICRVEDFHERIAGYRDGYAVWLTNDPSYWSKPTDDSVGYAAFSVHRDAVKQGTMPWGVSMGEGTTKGRDHALVLSGCYIIDWHDYSRVDAPNEIFMYSIVRVAGQD